MHPDGTGKTQRPRWDHHRAPVVADKPDLFGSGRPLCMDADEAT
jgi:hypothetical protein